MIRNGVDCDAFAPRPAARAEIRGELGLDEQTPLVGIVAAAPDDQFASGPDRDVAVARPRRVEGIDRPGNPIGGNDAIIVSGRNEIPRCGFKRDIATGGDMLSRAISEIYGLDLPQAEKRKREAAYTPLDDLEVPLFWRYGK